MPGKVEKYIAQKCESIWGDTWRELLDMYWDQNLFVRELLEAKLLTTDDVDDRVERLVNWINSRTRKATPPNQPRGCVLGEHSITCFRGGARGPDGGTREC